MDFNNSVIMPREDFLEMQAVAWNQPTPSGKERVAQTAQTTLIFAAMSGAVVAGSYGWAKAMDWLDEKRFQRKMRENEAKKTAQ